MSNIDKFLGKFSQDESSAQARSSPPAGRCPGGPILALHLHGADGPGAGPGALSCRSRLLVPGAILDCVCEVPVRPAKRAGVRSQDRAGGQSLLVLQLVWRIDELRFTIVLAEHTVIDDELSRRPAAGDFADPPVGSSRLHHLGELGDVRQFHGQREKSCGDSRLQSVAMVSVTVVVDIERERDIDAVRVEVPPVVHQWTRRLAWTWNMKVVLHVIHSVNYVAESEIISVRVVHDELN